MTFDRPVVLVGTLCFCGINKAHILGWVLFGEHYVLWGTSLFFGLDLEDQSDEHTTSSYVCICLQSEAWFDEHMKTLPPTSHCISGYSARVGKHHFMYLSIFNQGGNSIPGLLFF